MSRAPEDAAAWPPIRVVLSKPLAIEHAEPAFEEAPALAGVLALETGDGRVVQIVSTANIRAALRRRLGTTDDETEEKSRRTDLRSVVGRARWMTAGSDLERDLLFLETARQLAEATHREACRRWQGWFLHVDPDEAYPRWTKVALPGWLATKGAAAPPEGGSLLGPFRDKHAAQKAAETLDELFDLCRYHHILVQAPNGLACAYKEMGKCPAPCDGSEAMETYRNRVAEAAEFAAGPVSRRLRDLEEAMADAADAKAFEEAATLKDRLERAKPLTTRACAWCGDLARFAIVAVGPSEKRGWGRLTLFAGGEAYSVADLDPYSDESVLGDVARRIREIASDVLRDASTRALTDSAQERIGLLCSALYGSHEKGPRGSTMMRAEDVDAASLKRAIGKATRRRAKTSPSDEREQEFEGDRA